MEEFGMNRCVEQLVQKGGQRVELIRVLFIWYGPVERLDEYRMARRLCLREVRGGLVLVDNGQLGGWREGGLGQQRDYGGGCSKDWKEQTAHIYAGIFSGPCILFGPPFRALLDQHLEKGGMPLHNAVGVNCERGALLKIKAEVISVWTKGCMINNCVCVI